MCPWILSVHELRPAVIFAVTVLSLSILFSVTEIQIITNGIAPYAAISLRFTLDIHALRQFRFSVCQDGGICNNCRVQPV